MEVIQRNTLNKLRAWRFSETRKPLVLRGARQVGKTTLVKEFAKEYDIFLHLNLEKEDDCALFEAKNDVNLLIGYNPEMTYEGLTRALQVALHAKQIIACNKERVFPGENQRPMPGCGAMTAPIEWCTHRDCDLVIGKLNTFIVDDLIENYK